ncbi:MAG: hypothetical protein OHK005_07270 [Candidatus Methylacidiphilales bacterium]
MVRCPRGTERRMHDRSPAPLNESVRNITTKRGDTATKWPKLVRDEPGRRMKIHQKIIRKLFDKTGLSREGQPFTITI